MPGSQYFKEKQQKSLNSFINGDAADEWKPDARYALEFNQTVERVHNDLNQGILTKFAVLRSRQVDKIASTNCFENQSYTFNEAKMCHKFHVDNDYKLNAINSFWKDHFTKHLLSYEQCKVGLSDIPSIADKDRAFSDCHNQWIKDFKKEQSNAFEERARSLLGRNLE